MLESRRSSLQKFARQTSAAESEKDEFCESITKVKNSNKKPVNSCRSIELKSSTIRQHYYPEGGFGWIIGGIAAVVHCITSGLQLSFGVLILHLKNERLLRDNSAMERALMACLSYSLSLFITPIFVAFCRKNSVRLSAIIGGLILSLGCLFASFATQFHQAFISYALFFGIGVGVTREASNIMIGQYFKRKRPLVEIIVQCGIGFGISIMSIVFGFLIKRLKWRPTFQILALIAVFTFFAAALYRSASLYHPQRRAILHLKSQKRKIREKVPQKENSPFIDFTILKSKCQTLLMTSTAFCSFAYLWPLFDSREVCLNEHSTNVTLNVESKPTITSTVINLNAYIGVSYSVGVILNGYLTVRNQNACRKRLKRLCQFSMTGIGISIIALFSTANCYTTVYYVVMIVYGFLLGSLHYSVKLLVFHQTRARYFGLTWSFVQWSQSIPILLGISFSVYFNQSTNFVYILPSICCFVGAFIMSFVSSKNPNSSEFRDSKSQDSTSYANSQNKSIECPEFDYETGVASRMESNDNWMSKVSYSSHCFHCGQDLLLLVAESNADGLTTHCSRETVAGEEKADTSGCNHQTRSAMNRKLFERRTHGKPYRMRSMSVDCDIKLTYMKPFRTVFDTLSEEALSST